MGIENLLKIVKEDALKDINQVISNAKAQEEKILGEAEKEAEEIKSNYMGEAAKKLKVDCAMILNEATLSAKKEVNKAKEEVIREVFSETENRLKEIRKSKDYEKILRGFISEIKKEMDTKWVVKAGTEDKKILKNLLESTDIEYEIADNTLDICGGFIAVSDRITVYNTFESRLQRVKSFIGPELSSILFR